MRVVGLTGKAGAGKSTAAQALVERRGFVSVGFADALKELALRVDPVNWGDEGVSLREAVEMHGWERAKDTYDFRRFLQELGTGVRAILGEDSWVEAWAARVDALAEMVGVNPVRLRGPDVVVPDVRFLNEAEVVRYGAAGETGLVVRIVRPGLDTTDSHVSETEMDWIEPDATIYNDSTPEALSARVLSVVDGWGLLPVVL